MSTPNSQSLLDWLSGSVMTELAASQDIAPGLPKPFPAEFYQYSPTEVVGINVQYDVVQGVRSTAPIVDYLSPSKGVNVQPRARKQATALGTRIQTPLDGEFITAIQSPIPLWQQRARTIMKQKQQDFRMLADNMLTSMPHAALATGQINVDRNGNLLVNSTGASVTVDYGLTYAGSNKLNKNSYWPNQTAVMVGDWSSAGTDIPTSVRTANQSFLLTSNYVAAHCIYGKNIPKYMYNNTAMQTFLSRGQRLNLEFMENNEVPQGLLNLQWHKGYEAYYVDNSTGTATTQTWVGDDQIIIYPQVSSMWYEYLLCSIPCPTGMVNLGANMEQFLSSCPPVRGYSSYCIPRYDPPSLDMISQVYALPAIKNVLGIFSATVA